MEVFELIVDEKVSVWRRSYIEIEAESLEDAVKDCIENGVSNATNFTDSEYLDETEEAAKQDDYLNPITVEVMDRSYEILGNNDCRQL